MATAVLGIGVDIVHTPRIASIFTRRSPQRLATRILSREELAQWESLPTSNLSSRARFLAVRWCAKEAAYKALYPNVRPTWKELTYRGLRPGREGMKPTLVYHPMIAAEATKIGRIHISISHDGDYVVAFITIEAPNEAA